MARLTGFEPALLRSCLLQPLSYILYFMARIEGIEPPFNSKPVKKKNIPEDTMVPYRNTHQVSFKSVFIPLNY